MKKILFFVLFVGILIAASNVEANTMAVTINTPSAGSSLNKGSSLTLNATVSCSGASGKCNGLNLQYYGTLPTSSTNPEGCGSPDVGTACTKTWAISADSVGSKTLNITATSTSADTASSVVSITVNSVCGDGAIDGSEICDGSNISSQTCVSRGFDQGTLACRSDCTDYDTNGCSFFSCGNNIKEGNETCDGTDLGSQTCGSRGYASGTLSCKPNCGSFETGNCVEKKESGPRKILGTMNIQVASPSANQTFRNGERVPVKISLLDELIQISGAVVNFAWNQKTARLIYSPSSKMYEGEILLESLKEGVYTIDISATHNDYLHAKKSVNFNINPSLLIASSLKNEYILGEEIVIKGSLADFRNVYASGNLTITAELEKIKLFEKRIESNGTFEYRYKTGFFDPEGNWTITAKASDVSGNSGTLSKSVPVKLVSEAGFYSVKFISPPPNSVFKRGEQVKITVEVQKDGVNIEGGNFSFRGPGDGNIVFLKEVSAGVYSINYRLGLDSPEGNIPLYVSGFKETENKTLSGAGKLPINVEKTGLILEIISPAADNLIVGKPVDIIVKAAYSDGTVPDNLDIFANSPSGGKIALTKKGENYVGSYKLKEGEEGVWKMELKAVDPYQNTGSKLATFSVGKITPLYIILENLTSIIISSVIIAALLSVFAVFRHKKNYKKNLRKELGKILSLKKGAQIKYYNENSITKATYQELMGKYEEREADVRKKLSAEKA